MKLWSVKEVLPFGKGLLLIFVSPLCEGSVVCLILWTGTLLLRLATQTVIGGCEQAEFLLDMQGGIFSWLSLIHPAIPDGELDLGVMCQAEAQGLDALL